MECQYCKNKFSTKPNLIHHQKTARYCLKLRTDVKINIQDYKCHICSKKYTSNFRLSSHLTKCIKTSDELICLREEVKLLKQYNNNLEQTVNEQKQAIRELQDKLGNIAIKAVSRSTTTKNTQITNYIQNMQPVTDEHLHDNAHHLSINHILRGPEGYADYALEYPLKDRLICVDYARRKVKFKDRDGNVITDPEMTNLATKFFNSIKNKNKELILEYGEQLKENFGDEVDTIVKIFDYKSAVDNGSAGNKTEFHHDFVKQMCSKTIKEDQVL